MDAIVTTLAPTFGAEALKLWGSYAFCLIALGWMSWRAEKRTKDKDSEIATLKAENKALGDRISQIQDQRVDEARKMVPVIETSTQTAMARAQGDAVFLEKIIKGLDKIGDRLEAVEDRFDSPARLPRPRGPR